MSLVAQTLQSFDYDSVSGPRVKKMKNLEMFKTEDVKKKSAAIVGFNEILLRVQEYYVAKTMKAKAKMKQNMNQ